MEEFKNGNHRTFKSKIRDYHPETGFYGENKPFTKAITSSFEPEYAEGSLYADNTRIEYSKELISGTLTLAENDNDPAVFGEILGLPYNETTGLLQFGTNSNPPFVGFGEIGEVIKRRN
jgi:hypothetical protein